jgi:Fe(3+) dicitrate transport protein
MKNTLLICLVLLLCSHIVQSQTENDTVSVLSEVVVIGERAKSIPGSGQYISSRKLALLNQPNINHVLRMIPGVIIRDEEGFGLRPNIGLRGTPVNRSAKITLMEDGILIAPAPYADPAAYYFPTFMRMNGVEVLKGSSQIKYGPYTVGGVVNMLSTPIPSSFKGFAQISYGSFNTNQQRVWLGDSRKNFDYIFEVNRFASDGFKQLDNGGNTGFERRDIMGKLRWHTDENASVPQYVTLKFLSFSEQGNEAYLGLTYEDYKANPLRRYAATQKDRIDMNRNDISLNYTILPAKGLSITTTAYYTYTFRDWARVNTIGGQSLNNILANPMAQQTAYQIMIGKASGNIDYQSAARTFFTQGIQSNAQYMFRTGALTHNIQVGLRYHSDKADRYGTRSTYSMSNGVMVLTSAGVQGNAENQIRKANSLATYLSYDVIYKGLRVTAGLRHEKINFEFQNYGNADVGRMGTALRTATNDLSVFLPGLGLNYEFNENMSAFAGVHKGFSPPGMPSVTSTTGQAKPETSLSYEVGYRYNNKGLNVQIAGFMNNYRNILGSDMLSTGGLGTGDMFNAGKALIQGLEINVEYDLLGRGNPEAKLRLPLGFVYTYTDARFQETFMGSGGDFGSGQINKKDFIPFTTPHLWTASLSIENDRFNVSLVGRYVSTTRTKPGQGDVILPAQNVRYNDVNAIGSFLMIDLSANYKFAKNFTAFTTINNITNNRNIVANLPNGYRTNMPFALNVGLKVDF